LAIREAELASDEDAWVRTLIAKRRPEAIAQRYELERLSADPDWSVRKQLAERQDLYIGDATAVDRVEMAINWRRQA
jgi:hypothetical protein